MPLMYQVVERLRGNRHTAHRVCQAVRASSERMCDSPSTMHVFMSVHQSPFCKYSIFLHLSTSLNDLKAWRWSARTNLLEDTVFVAND